MADTARERLAMVLRGNSPPAFTAELTVPPDCLSVEVEGFGRLKLPVTAERAGELARLGVPARFGRGEQTLTDRSVRDTWEIPLHRVRAEWDATLDRFLTAARLELGFPHGTGLTAQLHSMLVYEEGQFFLPHQDSEKSDTMVATLVVALPSSCWGGELVVEHNGAQQVCRTAGNEVSMFAFFADCRHEVKPVRSGHRISLTYNLMLHGEPSGLAARDRTVAELSDLLGEHFRTPVPSVPWMPEPALPPARLAYLLDHQYTARSLDWSRLKGEDASRAALLRAAAEQAGCEAILALARLHQVDEACRAGESGGWAYHHRWRGENGDAYDIFRPRGTWVGLKHWTGPDGRLEEVSLTLEDDSEVCASTPNDDLAPHKQHYEPFTGNEGQQLDRWYRRAAILVWPRELAFTNRAEACPDRALDELIAMASAGDAARARAVVATLRPHWYNQAYPGDCETRSELLDGSLAAALAVDGEQAATQLLDHFWIDELELEHVQPLARVAARYGEQWTARLLDGWLSRVWERWMRHGLPYWCERLTAEAGAGALAAQLLSVSWERVAARIDAKRSVRPAYRDEVLGSLGEPLAGVLTAAVELGSGATLTAIARFLAQHDTDVTATEIAALKAVTMTMLREHHADFEAVAQDCARRLRARLARPLRDRDDWSLDLPAGDCACELCGRLRAFLADRQQRIVRWPLDRKDREHVSDQLRGSGLPVTVKNKRVSRDDAPDLTALTKTSAVFARELDDRDRDDSDLLWLADEGFAVADR